MTQPNMPRYRHDHFIEVIYEDGASPHLYAQFPPEYEAALKAEGWVYFNSLPVAWWTSERKVGLRPEQEEWHGPFETLREACQYWEEYGIDPWTGERLGPSVPVKTWRLLYGGKPVESTSDLPPVKTWRDIYKNTDHVAGITNQEPQKWPLNTGRLTLWQSWFWRGFSTLWQSLLVSLRSDRELQFYCLVGVIGLIAAIIVYGRQI